MIELTENQLDPQQALEAVRSPHAGAVLLFLGTTREATGGRATESLDYDCYRAMAESKLVELESVARGRWDLIEVCLVHRLGHLNVGEASVVVAVSAAHRKAAFEAGRWLIDTVKQVVPIWKRENWADGDSQWVHPGVPEA